jgi:hypothetical protein
MGSPLDVAYIGVGRQARDLAFGSMKTAIEMANLKDTTPEEIAAMLKPSAREAVSEGITSDFKAMVAQLPRGHEILKALFFDE